MHRPPRTTRPGRTAPWPRRPDHRGAGRRRARRRARSPPRPRRPRPGGTGRLAVPHRRAHRRRTRPRRPAGGWPCRPAGCAEHDPGPVCGLVTRLNELDGFDLDPRLALDFDRAGRRGRRRPPSITRPGRRRRAAASTGSSTTRRPTRSTPTRCTSSTRARPTALTVSAGRAGQRPTATFTTLSARDGLLDLRAELDNGRAYRRGGHRRRRARPDASTRSCRPTARTFTYDADTGSGRLGPGARRRSLARRHGRLRLLPGAVRGSRPDRTIAQTPDRRRTARPGRREPGCRSWLVLPRRPGPGRRLPDDRLRPRLHPHRRRRAAGGRRRRAAPAWRPSPPTSSGTATARRSTWTLTAGGATAPVPAYAPRRRPRRQRHHRLAPRAAARCRTARPPRSAAATACARPSADVMTLVRGRAAAAWTSTARRHELRTHRHRATSVRASAASTAPCSPAPTRWSPARCSTSPGGPITEIVRLSPVFRLLHHASRCSSPACSTAPTADQGSSSSRCRCAGRPPVLDPAPGALADPGLPRRRPPGSTGPAARRPSRRGSQDDGVLAAGRPTATRPCPTPPPTPCSRRASCSAGPRSTATTAPPHGRARTRTASCSTCANFPAAARPGAGPGGGVPHHRRARSTPTATGDVWQLRPRPPTCSGR